MVAVVKQIQDYMTKPDGVRLSDVQPTRIAWRSRGRVARGKLTVMDGDPGLGKSTLLMDWAAKVSRGLALPDGDPQPERGVLLICAEDDPHDTIVPRLKVMGADLRQIILLFERTNPDPDAAPGSTRFIQLPDDVEIIEQFLVSGKIGLVIVDPLMAFLNPYLKSNSDQDVRQALTPLAKCMERTGASCILVRHLNKGIASNSLYRGGGSIGIIGIARFGLLVAKDHSDPQIRVLASTKTNLGPPPASLKFRMVGVENEDVAKIEWLGETFASADDLLLDQQLSDEQRQQDDEADELLISIITTQAVTSKAEMIDRFKRQNLSVRSLERALNRAKKTHSLRISKIGGSHDTSAVWVWHLSTVNPYAPVHPTQSSFNDGAGVDGVDGVDQMDRNSAELRRFSSD